MGFLKQTAVYIFKREAYRGFRQVTTRGIPSAGMTFFSAIGAIFWSIVLLVWIVNDGMPMIFTIASCFALAMTLANLSSSSKIQYTVDMFEISESNGHTETVVFNLKQQRYKEQKLRAAKMWGVWFLTFAFFYYLSNFIPHGELLKLLNDLEKYLDKH